MLLHTYITVNEDELKEHKKSGWHGDLADYAAHMFNKWKDAIIPDAMVVSVESTSWINEIRPVMCNSATWYNRRTMKLSVWLEASHIIPVKIRFTETAREWFNNRKEKGKVDGPYVEKDFLWKLTDIDSEGYVDISTEPHSAPAIYVPMDFCEIIG